MFKRIIIFFTVIFTAVILTGCPGVLISDLPSDLMISLGVFRSAEGVSSLNSALGGKIHAPILISDLSGRAAAESYDVTFTLDTDGDLATTGDNILVGIDSVTAGIETILTFDIPATAAATTYNLYAAFAAAEGDPATMVGTDLLNIGVVPLVVGATNEADLELEFVDPPSAVRLPGGTFPLSFKVKNTGNKLLAAETAILIRFEIPISAVDTEFGTTTITLTEDLYPNDFVTGTAAITMPSLTQIAADLIVAEADVDNWSDTLTGTVDPDNSITEIVEGGTDTFIVNSGTRKPDLVINSIDVPAYAVVDGAVEVAVTIRNDGYEHAAAGSYGLILFNDANTNGAYDAGTDDVLRTWTDAESVAVPWDPDGGAYNRIVYTTTASDAFTYPAAMTAGDHEIGAVITGTLDEWDSTNNTGTEDIHMVTDRVDLEVTSITSTINTVIDNSGDATVPVTVALINSGKVELTTDFTVEFFLSSDSNLYSVGDTSIGSVVVTDNMTPGVSGQVTVSYDTTIVSGTSAGFYTIYAVVDSADDIAEMNEGNNQVSSPSDSPVYVVVDDGSSTLNARILYYYPKADSSGYFYQYLRYYDTIWDTDPALNYKSDSYYNYNYSGPRLYDDVYITITRGQEHGVLIYTNNSNHAVCWRIVPTYVYSINNDYIPNALVSEDPYESNNNTTTATELTGASLPFYSWISSYQTSSSDHEYFTFSY